MGKTLFFKPGTLMEQVKQRSIEALRSGVLESIDTRTESLRDEGVLFQVRVLDGLRKKTQALQRLAKAGDNSLNPFLPYDKALWVTDLTDYYCCLLNKFNVVNHHMLLVTRSFQLQNTELERSDFFALSTVMAEFEALAFFNSAPQAGASQPHRHLQVVPLDDGANPLRVPMESRLLGCNPPPFAHRFIPLRLSLDNIAAMAEQLYQGYQACIESCALKQPGKSALRPYNLLLTRRWMLCVPRGREEVDNISINALGFAGSLLVCDQQQLERIRSLGPMRALVSVAGSR